MTVTHYRPVIRALLIDLSGNIHVGSTPIQGAVQALQRLRESGIPFRFCSNTSKESTGSLRTRLVGMGFDVQSNGGGAGREEVWTSIGAVKRVAGTMGLKRPYFLLSDSVCEELASALGIPLEDRNEAPFDSVIVGLSPGKFDYDNLNTAFRILIGEHHLTSPPQSHPLNPSNVSSSPQLPGSVPFIATHKAKYLQISSSAGLSLGPGPFVTALEHASGLKAHVVGKPTKGFFETVIGDFTPDELGGSDEGAGRIAVIGDDVEADLGEGAIELGLWRILVRTGKYRAGDEARPGVIPPDEVCDSFASFIDSLISGQRAMRGGRP